MSSTLDQTARSKPRSSSNPPRAPPKRDPFHSLSNTINNMNNTIKTENKDELDAVDEKNNIDEKQNSKPQEEVIVQSNADEQKDINNKNKVNFANLYQDSADDSDENAEEKYKNMPSPANQRRRIVRRGGNSPNNTINNNDASKPDENENEESDDDPTLNTKPNQYLVVGRRHIMNIHETSCFCFGYDHDQAACNIRRGFFRVFDHWIFDLILVILILYNLCYFIIDAPFGRALPGGIALVEYSEYAIQGLFTIEILMKIASLGFILHPYSFCRDPLRFLEMIVVICGYIAIPLYATRWRVLRNLKLIRLFRILERIMQYVPELRGIFDALVGGLPRFADIALFVSFLVIALSIVGVQLFRGEFHNRCYFVPPESSIQDARLTASGASSYKSVVYQNSSYMYNNNNYSDQITIFYGSSPQLTQSGIFNYTPSTASPSSSSNNQSLAAPSSPLTTAILDPLNFWPCARDTPGEDIKTGGLTPCDRGATCLKNNSIFTLPYTHFDHLGYAAFTVLKLTSIDGLQDDIRRMSYTTGSVSALFGILIVFLIAFCAMNFFIALLSWEYDIACQRHLPPKTNSLLLKKQKEMEGEARLRRRRSSAKLMGRDEEAAEDHEEQEKRHQNDDGNREETVSPHRASPLTSNSDEDDDDDSEVEEVGGEELKQIETSNNNNADDAEPSSKVIVNSEDQARKEKEKRKKNRLRRNQKRQREKANRLIHRQNQEALLPPWADPLPLEREDFISTSSEEDEEEDEKVVQNNINIDSAKTKSEKSDNNTDSKKDQVATAAPRRPLGKLLLKGINLVRFFLYQYCVGTSVFFWFSVFVTTLNVVILAVFFEGMSSDLVNVFNWINIACGIFFVVETIFKLYVFFPKRYVKLKTNIFEFLLAACVVAELATLDGTNSKSSVFAAMRAIRMLRIFSLAVKFERPRQILLTVASAAKASFMLFLVLLAYVTFSALFALYLFEDSVPSSQRPNFTDLPQSILAMFVILSGENWVSIVINVMQGSSPAAAVFFFIYFFFGTYLLLNLFVVIVIASYKHTAEEIEEWRLKEHQEIEREKKHRRRQELKELRKNTNYEKDADDELQVNSTNHNNDETLTNTKNPEDHELEDEFAKNIIKAVDGNENNNNCQHSSSLDVEKIQQENQNNPDDEVKKSSTAAPSRNSPNNNNNNNNSNNVNSSGDSNGRNSPGSPNGARTIREKQRKSLAHRLALWMGHDFYQTPDAVIASLVGDSLYLFSCQNCFRQYCAVVVSHPYFEFFTTLVILESLIVLGFETKKSVEDISYLLGENLASDWIRVNNIVITCWFTFEMILKMIGFGVIMREKENIQEENVAHPYYARPYFWERWNQFDFIVVLITILSNIVPTSFLKALRIFRFAAKWHNQKVVLSAMMRAIPDFLNVVVLVLAFVFLVAVLGVQLFQGRFSDCNDPDILFKADCVGNYTVQRIWYEQKSDIFAAPLNNRSNITNNFTAGAIVATILHNSTAIVPRRWVTPFYNYDDTPNGLVSSILLFWNDGWVDVMWNAIDSSADDGIGLVPTAWNTVPVIYFIFFMIIGNFFLNNLFIGTLLDLFKKQHTYEVGLSDEEGNQLLTSEQEQWIRNFRFAQATSLPDPPPMPLNKFRKFCCRLYFEDDQTREEVSHLFEFAVSIAVFINVAFMATEYEGMSSFWESFLYYENLLLTVFFALEVIVSFTALLPRAFFDDSNNVFNVLVTIGSFISLRYAGPGINIVRVVRMFRILRAIKSARGVYRLFQALVYSIPQIFNVSILVILILYIFGITATQLFGNAYIDTTDLNEPLGPHYNFQHAGYSILTLIQVATTDNWAAVMKKLAGMTPENSGCSFAQDASSSASLACGNWYAILFFTFFILVAHSIAINLYIFVIVDNVLELNELNDVKTQWMLRQLADFRKLWMQFDRRRQKQLRWQYLVLILRHMLVMEKNTLKSFRREIGVPIRVYRSGEEDTLVVQSLIDLRSADKHSAQGLEVQLRAYYKRLKRREKRRKLDKLRQEFVEREMEKQRKAVEAAAAAALKNASSSSPNSTMMRRSNNNNNRNGNINNPNSPDYLASTNRSGRRLPPQIPSQNNKMMKVQGGSSYAVPIVQNQYGLLLNGNNNNNNNGFFTGNNNNNAAYEIVLPEELEMTSSSSDSDFAYGNSRRNKNGGDDGENDGILSSDSSSSSSSSSSEDASGRNGGTSARKIQEQIRKVKKRKMKQERLKRLQKQKEEKEQENNEQQAKSFAVYNPQDVDEHGNLVDHRLDVKTVALSVVAATRSAKDKKKHEDGGDDTKQQGESSKDKKADQKAKQRDIADNSNNNIDDDTWCVSEKFLLKRLQSLAIPVMKGGMVDYSDCVFGLTRLHAGSTEELSGYAKDFILARVRNVDHSQTFQVHHAVAAMKIWRWWKRINAELEKEMEDAAMDFLLRAALDAQEQQQQFNQLERSNNSLTTSSSHATSSQLFHQQLLSDSGMWYRNNNAHTNNNAAALAALEALQKAGKMDELKRAVARKQQKEAQQQQKQSRNSAGRMRRVSLAPQFEVDGDDQQPSNARTGGRGRTGRDTDRNHRAASSSSSQSQQGTNYPLRRKFYVPLLAPSAAPTSCGDDDRSSTANGDHELNRSQGLGGSASLGRYKNSPQRRGSSTFIVTTEDEDEGESLSRKKKPVGVVVAVSEIGCSTDPLPKDLSTALARHLEREIAKTREANEQRKREEEEKIAREIRRRMKAESKAKRDADIRSGKRVHSHKPGSGSVNNNNKKNNNNNPESGQDTRAPTPQVNKLAIPPREYANESDLGTSSASSNEDSANEFTAEVGKFNYFQKNKHNNNKDSLQKNNKSNESSRTFVQQIAEERRRKNATTASSAGAGAFVYFDKKTINNNNNNINDKNAEPAAIVESTFDEREFQQDYSAKKDNPANKHIGLVREVVDETKRKQQEINEKLKQDAQEAERRKKQREEKQEHQQRHRNEPFEQAKIQNSEAQNKNRSDDEAFFLDDDNLDDEENLKNNGKKDERDLPSESDDLFDDLTDQRQNQSSNAIDKNVAPIRPIATINNNNNNGSSNAAAVASASPSSRQQQQQQQFQSTGQFIPPLHQLLGRVAKCNKKFDPQNLQLEQFQDMNNNNTQNNNSYYQRLFSFIPSNAPLLPLNVGQLVTVHDTIVGSLSNNNNNNNNNQNQQNNLFGWALCSRVAKPSLRGYVPVDCISDAMSGVGLTVLNPTTITNNKINNNNNTHSHEGVVPFKISKHDTSSVPRKFHSYNRTLDNMLTTLKNNNYNNNNDDGNSQNDISLVESPRPYLVNNNNNNFNPRSIPPIRLFGSSSPSRKETAQVLYDFDADFDQQDGIELSVRVGDVVEILEKDDGDGWTKVLVVSSSESGGNNNNRIHQSGIVPSSYLFRLTSAQNNNHNNTQFFSPEVGSHNNNKNHHDHYDANENDDADTATIDHNHNNNNNNNQGNDETDLETELQTYLDTNDEERRQNLHRRQESSDFSLRRRVDELRRKMELEHDQRQQMPQKQQNAPY